MNQTRGKSEFQREYFYSIDKKGRLSHDGTELTDETFLDFFYERLKQNDTGVHAEYPFVSPCGHEMNFVRVTEGGSPIVFTRLDAGRLFYAPSLFVEFDPDALRFAGSAADALLHPSPVGGYGRLRSDLVMELSQCIEPWGPYFAYVMRPDVQDPFGFPRLRVIEPVSPPPELLVFRSEKDVLCFGCGGSNRRGMALPFLFDTARNQATGWMRPPQWMAGHPQYMHGGFISLLHDEVMAKVLKGIGKRGFTANLNVDFRKPCLIDEELQLEATLDRADGRKVRIRSAIKNASGGILSEAQALFIAAGHV